MYIFNKCTNDLGKKTVPNLKTVGGVQARIQKIFPGGGPTLSKTDSVWRITVEVHKYEK